jgi:outer membrane cobalamin receptor
VAGRKVTLSVDGMKRWGYEKGKDMSHKYALKCALVCAVMGGCAQVYADDKDYLSMNLEQLLQVAVTGSTLRDESLKTVPAAVTVFTHDQLEKLGVDYLYELINLVPGYQFDRSGDNGVNYTFSARGRRNGSQSREILVVMDGRMLASPRTGSVDVSLPLIPLERIERIEVIRGPGSSIYGSSAFTGVINIVTRTEQNLAKVDVGSDARRSLSLSLSKPLGEWSANLYAHAYEDQGQDYWVRDTFNGSHLQTDDPRKMLGFDLGLSREDTRLRFAYDRTKASNFFQIENTQNGFNGADITFTQISVEQGLHLIDAVTSQVSLEYLKTEQNLQVAAAGPGVLAAISQPKSTEPLLVKADLVGESYNLRVINNWMPDEHSTALLGAEWKYEAETQARIQNNFDLGQLAQGIRPIAYYGDFTHSTPLGLMESVRSQGVFTQYQRQLNQRTALTLGLRYDDYDNLGGRVSPRFGLVYQLSDIHTLKLLYGEAFRAPSLSETGLINNPLIAGNPKLEYEIVKTWDAVWMATWHKTTVSLDAFHSRYKNPIVAGLDGSVRTFVNSTDESSDGMTLEAAHSLTQHWSMRATYTDFLQLPQSAYREAKQLASLEVNFNQGAWNWNLLGYHQDERYALDSSNSFLHRLDGFWAVNSKLRYSFQQGYTLSVQLKNMEDANFATPSQGGNLTQGVPNRGREVSVALEWPL